MTKSNLFFKNNREKERFFKNLRKYLILAFILILSSIPTYIVAFNTSKKNELQKTSADFLLSFDNFDNLLYDLSNQGLSLLTSDADTVLLLNKTHDFNSKDYIAMKRINSNLRSSILGKSIITNVYILNKNNNIFLSGDMISDDSDNVFKYFYKIEGYNKETWEEEIFSRKTPTFFIPNLNSVNHFSRENAKPNTEIVHFGIFGGNSPSLIQKNCIVYMLDTKMIHDLFIKNYLEEDSFFYLEDSFGNIIYQNNYDSDYNSKHYQVFSENSYNIKAVLGIKNSFFYSQTSTIIYFLLFYGLFFVVLSILVSLFFNFIDQKNINFVINSIKDMTSLEEDKNINQYDYINRGINFLNDEKNQFEKEIATMSNSITNSTMYNIIFGNIFDKDDEANARQFLEIDYNNNFCITIMNLIDDFTLEEVSQINTIVKNIIFSKTNLKSSSYNTDTASTYFIIFLPDNTSTNLLFLKDAFKIAHEKLRKEYNFSVLFGIGTISPNLQNIFESTNNAKSVLRLANFENPIKIYQDSKDNIRKSYISTEELLKLKESISLGLVDYVEFFYKKLNKNLNNLTSINQSEIYQLYFSLKNAIMEVYYESFPDFIERDNLQIDIKNSTIDEIIVFLKNRSVQTASLINNASKESTSILAKDILKYVDGNYMNSNLSASFIGDKLNISEKYVFTIIKSATNKSLGEYIETARFSHVENLLLKNTPINEIPELVGFNSINTFYKAFKRIYGTSPAKWRDTKKSQE